MDFNDYQNSTIDTAVYPEAGTGSWFAINYTILGLANEAGEVAGKWKKAIRDEVPRDVVIEQLKSELGDCLWYAAQLANEAGLNLDDIAEHNLTKLNNRKLAGTLHGSGDNR